MKNLLTCFCVVVTVFTAYSQDSYLIEKDVFIYGLGDGELITGKQINNKAHLKHYDSAGDIIWEDSISFNVAVESSKFDWISRFKGTDELVVCMESVLEHSFYFNDTAIVHFEKLNLTSHDFVASFEDTFIVAAVVPIEYKDTSLYVSFADFSNLTSSDFNHATYSLNSGFEFSLIAPLDSVWCYLLGWSYYAFGDSIYKYQNYNEYHVFEKYSNEMSLLVRYENWIETGEEYDDVCYRQAINSDSIFVFTQGTTNGGIYHTKWRFDWRNIDMSPKNSSLINSFTNDTGAFSLIRGYKTNGQVKLDKVNRRICILAEETIIESQIPYVAYTYQSVLVYDYDFNFLCEIPVAVRSATLPQSDTKKLLELNGLVYLQSQDYDNQSLIRMNCDILDAEELNGKSLNTSIFPNPALNYFNVVNEDNIDLTIKLLSMDGRELEVYSSNEPNVKIDVSDLTSGVYVVSIEGNGTIAMDRIIKK